MARLLLLACAALCACSHELPQDRSAEDGFTDAPFFADPLPNEGEGEGEGAGEGEGEGDADSGPPASSEQVCQAWTECGPHFADPNSGFDCVAGACVCNSEGNWDEACAGIGGVWAADACFCYVGAAPLPSEDADDDDDDNVSCWWVWKETCEPDEWVETSDYDWVCSSSDDCGWEYVEDGYWESGSCDGFWIKRCDDGTEHWFGP